MQIGSHAIWTETVATCILKGGVLTLEEAIKWFDRQLLSLSHFSRAAVACLRIYTGRAAESLQR